MLSGGQRQRVALGRAIVRNPQVFLFDEPLSNLDAKLRVQMRVEIKKLHQRLATTSIYVTHDQVEAMTLGDRVVVMKDGLIQQVGEPLELYNNPANKYVAGFIGSPAMNFADTMIEEAGNAVYATNPTMRIRVPEQIAARMGPHMGKPATLGIRPEDLHMATGADPEDLFVRCGGGGRRATRLRDHPGLESRRWRDGRQRRANRQGEAPAEDPPRHQPDGSSVLRRGDRSGNLTTALDAGVPNLSQEYRRDMGLPASKS